MSVRAATPYLKFFGRAAEAIEHYQQAFGATVKLAQRFGEVMHQCPAALADRIMHAELDLGPAIIMLSDGEPDGVPAERDNVVVALSFDDEAAARKCFDALAEGGKVVEPLAPAPWGALFGAVGDRFGIPWMFNVQLG